MLKTLCVDRTMDTGSNTITPWLPFIGTVIGAGIAFLATYANARYNKNKELEIAKANRNRGRIERIYKLLVTIGSESSHELKEALMHIRSGTPFTEKTSPELPPLIELEMLVSLYFPDLEAKRIELVKVVQEFGEKYFEFRFKDYRNESLPTKQEDSGALVALHGQVRSHVEEMSKLLVEHVEA